MQRDTVMDKKICLLLISVMTLFTFYPSSNKFIIDTNVKNISRRMKNIIEDEFVQRFLTLTEDISDKKAELIKVIIARLFSLKNDWTTDRKLLGLKIATLYPEIYEAREELLKEKMLALLGENAQKSITLEELELIEELCLDDDWTLEMLINFTNAGGGGLLGEPYERIAHILAKFGKGKKWLRNELLEIIRRKRGYFQRLVAIYRNSG